MPVNLFKNRRLLSLADRELITEYFRRYPPRISEFTFTNLFAWRQSRPVWLTELNATLLFFISGKHRIQSPDIVFGPPVGDCDLVEILNTLGNSICAGERFPAEAADRLSRHGFLIAPDRNNADYLYRVSDLAQLPGRKYAGKRNHIKQCLEQNRCAYQELTANLVDECLNLRNSWCAERECAKDPGLCGEFIAIKEALSHFEEFQLFGGAIRVNDELKAFSIGERLNETTAVCHFEKAMPRIHGLGQLMNKWFAIHALKDFQFVNREQDLGIPGLRLAKESYYPHAMVGKIKIGKP
jgi:hypothetical protein